MKNPLIIIVIVTVIYVMVMDGSESTKRLLGSGRKSIVGRILLHVQWACNMSCVRR